MTYKQFESKWLGKRVDYDRTYGYQCVDLVKQYVYEGFNLAPGAWGNAINWWTTTNPNLLTKFNKVSGSQGVQGDIVVLRGLSGNPYGHIGICTGGLTSTTIEILEQNGSTGNGTGTGGDAIRKRFVSRSRVAGLLRPKPVAPATVKGTLKSGTWNVRLGAYVGAGVIGVAQGNTTWDTVVVAGGWRKITFNGKVGYISPLGWR